MTSVELAARLRGEADYLDANISTFTGPLSVIPALRDGADAITALQAERVSLIDTKRDQIATLTSRLQAAEALAQTYAEALEKIADQAEHVKMGISIRNMDISRSAEVLVDLALEARATLKPPLIYAITDGEG